MAADAPPPAPVMTPDEVQAEAEQRMRDIGNRLITLPEENDELLRLLQEAYTWLERVDQNPPEGMFNTLRPTMARLISSELLEHPDPDVKVAVTSCLTEVTRITAPEAPYDDDVMKDVFKRIVEAFADLGDMDSPSFPRRASILDSVARVRCCVLMLDLDLDHLIVDMFRYFLRAISPSHSDLVISCMETIMMFVIQESDNVPEELASCLLQNLKKESQETSPAVFGLAERVTGLCKDKLKPTFIELIKGTPLDEYSEVVKLLCQDALDAAGTNNVNASGKDMAAECKLSERSASEESPQETSKLEQDVSCPGQDGTHPSSSPTTAISNGGAPFDNVKSPDGPASSEQKPELPSGDEQAKISDQLISGDKEASEQVTKETEKSCDLSLKNSQKLDSSTGSEMTEHCKVVKDNKSPVASGELSPEKNDGDDKQPAETEAADDTPKPVDTKPAVVKRRGRPPAVKSQEKKKKPVGNKQGSDLKSKKPDLVSDASGRGTGRLTRDDVKSSSTKASEGESGKKQQKSSLKLQKEESLSDESADEDISLKEMVSPNKTNKTKGEQGDSGGQKRKRLQEAEEAPESKKNKVLDEKLVGSRIKVWWPEDKMFYDGVITSFDASLKKHEVSYDDGDVEVLLLKDEKWEFITEEQDSDPDTASDTPRGRRAKGSLRQQMKGGKTGTPKSGARDPPKKRGRPKGVRSSNSPVTSATPKGKGVEKDTQETPKTGSNLKKEGARPSRSTGKTKDAVVKASNKDEAGGKKSKDEAGDNKSQDEAGSEDKDSKDEMKSSDAADGSKTNGLSTKRKAKESGGESSEEEQVSAKTSTGKKRRRKNRN